MSFWLPSDVAVISAIVKLFKILMASHALSRALVEITTTLSDSNS